MVVAIKTTSASNHSHAGLQQLFAHIFRLILCQIQQALVYQAKVNFSLWLYLFAIDGEVNTKGFGVSHALRGLGGRDQSLRRNHIGEHCISTNTGSLNQRYIGAQLNSG